MRWGLPLVLACVACSFEHGVLPPAGSDARSGDGPAGMMADAPAATVDAPRDAPAPPPSGVTCPGSMCGVICCEGTCISVATSVCTGKSYACDGPEDCASDEVCCNDQNGSYCTTNACNGNGHFEACHTGADCSFNCSDCSYRSDYGQKVCCE